MARSRVRSVTVEKWGKTHEVIPLELDDVPRVYESLPDGVSATFTWNNGGPVTLIVGVGADYSIASLLENNTFSEIEWSEDEGLREVEIGGQVSHHPVRYLMPREMGLKILMGVTDLPGLKSHYRWCAS